MSAGVIFVVSAPSGAGKTSLLHAVQQQTLIAPSISYTTRPPRSGERNGVHYYFIDDTQFTRMIDDGEFAEHADVFGYRYGTSLRFLNNRLAAGEECLLEIDVQGGDRIRSIFPDCVRIFILPPTRQALKERLANRKVMTVNLADRLQNNCKEMYRCFDYDYIVINDDFTKAVADICAIIRAASLRTKRQQRVNATLIQGLLDNSNQNKTDNAL